MTPTERILAEMKQRSDKTADAASDDFGHSVTACMEWQVGQLWKLNEDTSKLIAALERAVEVLRLECYCEKLHPDIGGKCDACGTLAEVEKILEEAAPSTSKTAP